jgi:hypothetical protein
MRILSFLSVLLFVLGSCASQKNGLGTRIEMKDIEIEYDANTRGFYQKLVIKKATISSTNDREGKENPIVQKIFDADWNALKDEINKLDLENLSNLKAPTEKRFYDGAAIANLKIIYNGKIYVAGSFGEYDGEIKRGIVRLNMDGSLDGSCRKGIEQQYFAQPSQNQSKAASHFYPLLCPQGDYLPLNPHGPNQQHGTAQAHL